jgi:putative membrane protein
MMGYYGPMMYGGYGGWFMWLLLIILFIVLIYLLARPESKGPCSGEKSMDILKKRYAKGEISKEEFDRIKKDLEV